jgi:ABC-type transport system involved in multi-copper enzyme maturation permease subunit
MQRILAIAGLTWKAAFRFRLFWILAILLLGSVLLFPLILKDDGTARGFIQIMLTYTLGTITALLGFSTLWLSCGLLARDIEECNIQMVAVKPIARWQIWLGKWLGILMLNAVLLAVSGGTMYVLLQYRAQHLPMAEQQILRNEIFVARGSLKEKVPDIEAAVEREFQARIKENAVPPNEYNLLRNQLREMAKAGVQIVPASYQKVWRLDLGLRKNFLKDQPLYLRVKFHAARTNAGGLYLGRWFAGAPGQLAVWQTQTSMSADDFHEFQITPNAFGPDGKLTVAFQNMNDTALLFPIEDGFEVLYREGGFGLNFIRGLLIIFFWLALLASIGLSASTFMSFPVAAFFSASLLVLALSTGTLSTVVSEGTVMGVNHETGARTMVWIDMVLLPVFRGMLDLINLVQSFSPIDALSTGRSISWEELGRAFAQIVLALGGLVGLSGVFIFTRRELATAQNSQ